MKTKQNHKKSAKPDAAKVESPENATKEANSSTEEKLKHRAPLKIVPSNEQENFGNEAEGPFSEQPETNERELFPKNQNV